MLQIGREGPRQKESLAGIGLAYIKSCLCIQSRHETECNSGILNVLRAVNPEPLSTVVRTSLEKTPPHAETLWKYPPQVCNRSQIFQWEK